MRPTPMASWLACALVTAVSTVLVTGAPAAADKKTDATKCVKYGQKTRDSAIEIRLTSSCDIDLECSVSWTLTCSESSAKHKAGKVFPLIAGDVAEIEASALLCGDDGWSIRGVKWACKSTDE